MFRLDKQPKTDDLKAVLEVMVICRSWQGDLLRGSPYHGQKSTLQFCEDQSFCKSVKSKNGSLTCCFLTGVEDGVRKHVVLMAVS